MDNEVKVKVEIKKPKRTNLTYTTKAYSNLLRLQKQFKTTTGGSISHERLINKIIEQTATL